MKIADIIKTEDDANIFLHNEGLFWRAYEYSAFAFIKNIKPYNTKKKFIKIVNSDIVFIGFPATTLHTILDLCKQKGFVVNKNDKLITIELKTKKEGFGIWKNEIEITESNKTKNDDSTLSERIANFPLATKTPMEAQRFLYKLQMEINGNL